MRGIAASKAGLWLAVSALCLAVALPDGKIAAARAPGLPRVVTLLGQPGVGAVAPVGPVCGINASSRERVDPGFFGHGQGCVSRAPVVRPLMHLCLRGGDGAEKKRGKRERTPSCEGGGGRDGGAPGKEAKRQRHAPSAVEADVGFAADRPRDSEAAAAAPAPALVDPKTIVSGEGVKDPAPKSKFIGVVARKGGQFAALYRKKVVGLYQKAEHAALAYDLASSAGWGRSGETRGAGKINFRQSLDAAAKMREEGKDPMEFVGELYERLGVGTLKQGDDSESMKSLEMQGQGRYVPVSMSLCLSLSLSSMCSFFLCMCTCMCLCTCTCLCLCLCEAWTWPMRRRESAGQLEVASSLILDPTLGAVPPAHR